MQDQDLHRVKLQKLVRVVNIEAKRLVYWCVIIIIKAHECWFN